MKEKIYIYPKLTTADTEEAIRLNRDVSLFRNIYMSHVEAGLYGEVVKKLSYRTKKGFNSEDKGNSFGYYCNEYVSNIHTIMKHFNLTSLVDLGCGAGLLLKGLSRFYVNLKGIDNEPALLKVMGYYCNTNVKKQKANIITLKKEDIEDYKAIYFWEPLICKDLSKKFVKNLVNIISPDQYILYKQAGVIGHYLSNHEKLEFVGEYNDLQVYKLKTD